MQIRLTGYIMSRIQFHSAFKVFRTNSICERVNMLGDSRFPNRIDGHLIHHASESPCITLVHERFRKFTDFTEVCMDEKP